MFQIEYRFRARKRFNLYLQYLQIVSLFSKSFMAEAISVSGRSEEYVVNGETLTLLIVSAICHTVTSFLYTLHSS